jgi:TPR repeat protein
VVLALALAWFAASGGRHDLDQKTVAFDQLPVPDPGRIASRGGSENPFDQMAAGGGSINIPTSPVGAAARGAESSAPHPVAQNNDPLANLVASAPTPDVPKFEDAVAARNRGDYEIALRLFRLLANQGDARAQFCLGAMYFGGEGVPQQDEAEAAKWFHLSAEQGELKAQAILGHMYMTGRGVPQDDGEAVKWLQKAADKGDAKAQDFLGDMYEDGHGVPRDYVRAHLWYSLSAAQGDQTGKFLQAEIVKHMTPGQIAEAQKLAREWKPTMQPRY